MKLDLKHGRIHFETEGRQGGTRGDNSDFVQAYCPCGGIILADTEGWAVPICYDCYEALGEPKSEPKLKATPYTLLHVDEIYLF